MMGPAAAADAATAFPRGKRPREDEEAEEAIQKKLKDDDFLFGARTEKITSTSAHKKKSKRLKTTSTATSTSTVSFLSSGGVVQNHKKTILIEAVSFSKLGKGCKLLAIVREVHDDFCLVSLPHLLTGYILPKTGDNEIPLTRQLLVGQMLAVVVIKTASESVGKNQPARRRIQVSVEPHLLNAATPSDVVRGRIASIQDHGVVVELGQRKKGFLNFSNIEGDYETEYDENVIKNDGDSQKHWLHEGRVLDFLVQESSTTSSIVPLRLTRSLAQHVTTFAKSQLMLSDLNPGALVSCQIDRVVSNGLLVKFGKVFQGAIHDQHLGGHWMPQNKSGASDWKTAFDDIKTLLARIVAVDAKTKLVRLSIQPHVLSLTKPPVLPPVGTVVEDATVLRLDPGIGALLSLPTLTEVPTGTFNEALAKNESYLEAAQRPAAHVHISKASSSSERLSEVDFNKQFAPSTKHKLRILSTTHWVDGVATAACAPKVVDAHVLQYTDLRPGNIYRDVPVCGQLEGGSVVVDFGQGIKGLIPVLHLFDQSATLTTDYRTKLRKELYALDKKVTVRVLHVDSDKKRCFATAKKSLLQATEPPICSYCDVRIGQVATGFVSKLDHQALYVTFFNKVYGRVTARSLAAELGIANLTEQYAIGDVVTCRVISCKPRRIGNKWTQDDEVEQLEDGSGYWDLNLSLCVDTDDNDEDAIERAKAKSRSIQLKAGAILHPKCLKIVELVPSIPKKQGEGFIPGHAIVRVKSKFIAKEEDVNVIPYLECKVPFDQLLDTYSDQDCNSVEAMDEFAKKHLTIGQKINSKGLVLTDPKKSSDEYASAIGKLPIISLRPKLIEAVEKLLERGEDETDTSDQVLVPSAESDLYVSAYVQGYVHQVDSRHGAFVRFLDNVTGLVPKMKKGLSLRRWDTVTCKIIALDVTTTPPKILLQKASPGPKPSSSNSSESLPRIKPGDVIENAEVVDVNFSRATLRILDKKLSASKNVRARIHVTMAQSAPTVYPNKRNLSEAAAEGESIRKGHPFYNWKQGKKISQLLCSSVDVRNGIVYADFASIHQDSDEPLLVFKKSSELHPGMKLSCVVVGVAKSRRGIWVQPSPGVTCFVPALELSEDVNVLNELESYFLPGDRIICRVMDKKSWKKRKNWGHHVVTPETEQDGNAFKDDEVPLLSKLLELEGNDAESTIVKKPVRGDLIVGRVTHSIRLYRPPSLMLELRGGFSGRCCITELDEPDEWVNMPLGRQRVYDTTNDKKADGKQQQGHHTEVDEAMDVDNTEFPDDSSGYKPGEYLHCRVLEGIASEPVVEVSLRPSRFEGDLEDDELPEEGELVQAFVVDTNKNGCFVRVARHVEGRVILKELADGFLPDPSNSFPMGRLVVGRVKSIKEGKTNGKSKVSSIVDIDLRESKLAEGVEKLQFDEIKLNEKYKGMVTRIEDYGVFVRIDNSNLSGLVHKSECSDNFIKNVKDLYDPGDVVKVLVIKKEDEGKKIGFSMKASHFIGDEDSDDVSSVGDDEDAEMVELNGKNEEIEEDSSEGDDDGLDSDDDKYVSKLASKLNAETGDNTDDDEDVHDNSPDSGETDEDDSDEDDSEHGDSEGKKDEGSKKAMDSNVGFQWGPEPVHDQNDDDVSDDDDGEEGEDGEKPKPHSSRKKAAARRLDEEQIRQREKALASDADPETAEDFERLLASQPNNSEQWIRYMAYFLSLADMDGCRTVAKRALARIDFRQEGEKLNIWTALLTMELKYGGGSKMFNDTLENACKHNNPKHIYLRACELLEKEIDNAGSTHQAIERADELYNKMCKKFRSKKKVWLAHLAYLVKRCGRHQEAHALLKRALASLPSYKHVEVMSKLAQLEFEFGSPERGRTVFDGILSKYPKRLDLLFVYVDKEVKAADGNMKTARQLLRSTAENPLTNLSDKQMKKLFRKWMKLEEDHGDENSREAVKDAARSYVARTSGSKS